MRKILLLLWLISSYEVFAQDAEEKEHTFFVNIGAGLGFTNYNFHTNSPNAPYTAPEINEAFILSLPFKASLMYHNPIMNVGYGLDERRINIGIGLKRQGLTGDYYDYDSTEYVDLRTTFYKFTGRVELILIEHERNGRTGGFGALIEAGSFFTRNPIGRPTRNGFCISVGGFYFHQVTDNLFLTLEVNEGYDRYKSLINLDYSTHNLFSTEILLGLRIKI
jgi:hypothetical protein